MSASYLRCSHCRGFYELALSHCRYCGKDVPVKGVEGWDKVFGDRETCRAIQVAEFEQLPKEAHEDYFQPDPQLLGRLCGCLHCGPEGGLFEAVEMRWMASEHKWACPCTTCGGRGFTFDIHLAEPLWQCAECEHWYEAPEGDRRASQAKCPQCGSTMANGWFDDEDDDVEAAWEEEGDELLLEAADAPDAEEKDDEVPWKDDVAPWDAAADEPYVPGPPPREKLPDDIDFPNERHEVPDEPDGDPLRDDDIPF